MADPGGGDEQHACGAPGMCTQVFSGLLKIPQPSGGQGIGFGKCPGRAGIEQPYL